MALREKAITGVLWSAIDNVAGQGITILSYVILARILGPEVVGLVGMLAIFIAISQSFIDSGFRQALIRKQNCSQVDYSTVFIFNIVVAILFYFILFFSARLISLYFNQSILFQLIRVLGLVLIINSFGIIHSTILTKDINFKLQAKISLIASTIAGVISIVLALIGFGVWSLVALTLSKNLIISILLWLYYKWIPSLIFSWKSFREMFSFGSKLLVSGLIDTTYRNIYNLIIGKYFFAAELGLYTMADQIQSFPSANLVGIVGKVSYPVLSSLQNDVARLRMVYEKMIRSLMLITFILMLGLAAVAKAFIVTILGNQWLMAVPYLQLLCLVGMFYPLHALNLNILQVQGRSDLYLKLEIIKKLLAVPVIIIGVYWGIKIMILGMLLNSIIAYYLNSYWSGSFIGYSFWNQVRDILPSFFLALIISMVVFVESLIIHIPSLSLLILQVTTGGILCLSICECLHNPDYFYLKGILFNKFKKVEYEN
jgi:O-antigen/teichoic acid export membrane protein